MTEQPPVASTSALPAYSYPSQPPSISPTTSMSPSSPRSVRSRPRPRRAYSETSDDSPAASREGSPPCTGPWPKPRRPSNSIAYDLPRALERSVALSRSRSNSSSDSTSASTSPVLVPSASHPPARPALSFKPASPNQPQAASFNAMPSSPLSLSPGSFASPGSKRQRNKKLLSLNIAIASPSQGSAGSSMSRSCPPSPLLVEGSSKDLDEMRANVRGDVRMSRRASIPRLSAIGSAAPAAEEDCANPVRLIGRSGEDGMDEADEAFPYANGPREILPGIYLGSEQNAKDVQCLRSLGIGYVLNVAKEVACPWSAEDTIAEEDESDPHSASRSGTSGNSGSSCASSPTHSDDSASPSSAATTVSAHSLEPNHEMKVSRSTSSELHRPHVIRSTASTPNLQASLSGPKSEAPTIKPSISSAPGYQAGLVLPPGIRRFGRNTLTGRPMLEYLHLPWGHDEDNLVARFPGAFAFVDRARAANGKVLVHCQCGVSRSATAVIAYVMREAASGHNETLSSVTGMHEAYQWVKDRSAWITPNMSLLYQLREWEQALSAVEGTVPSSPTTPSSLTPAMAHLDVPFDADEPTAVVRADQMETDLPHFGARIPSERREAHRRTFSTDMQ